MLALTNRLTRLQPVLKRGRAYSPTPPVWSFAHKYGRDLSRYNGAMCACLAPPDASGDFIQSQQVFHAVLRVHLRTVCGGAGVIGVNALTIFSPELLPLVVEGTEELMNLLG